MALKKKKNFVWNIKSENQEYFFSDVPLLTEIFR